MRVIAVNLLPRRNYRPLIVLLLASLLLTAAGWLGHQARLASLERETVAKRHAVVMAELRAVRERAVASRGASWPAAALAEARAAHRIAGFDWAGMLAAVESPRVPGVQLLVLDASAAEGSVRLEATAPDLAALLRYLGDINAGESDRRWDLVQLLEAQPGKPASMTLVGRRFGATTVGR